MRKRFLFFAVLIAACAVPSLLFAVGADHKGPVGGTDKWPQGLRDLANRPDRVHGYFLNFEDVFFYSGDTWAFNLFLDDYSKLEKTVLQVVIHPGPQWASSPWGKADPEIPVDWSLYASAYARDFIETGKPAEKFITRIDLFLGQKIGLEGLAIPDNVEVRSGGELEAFVAAHQEKQASQGKQ